MAEAASSASASAGHPGAGGSSAEKATTTAERSIASITDQVISTTSNPLAVTRSEHLAGLLEQVARAFKLGPHTMRPGVAAFNDFENEFTEEDARNVVDELKLAKDMSNVNVAAVKEARNTLVAEHAQTQLPYADLGFFLDVFCLTPPETSEQTTSDKVKHALDMLKLSNKYMPVSTSSKDAARKNAALLPVLERVKHGVDHAAQSFGRSAVALSDQHGDIPKDGSMEDLMKKLGDSVGVTEAQSYLEQLDQLAAGHNEVITTALKELSGLIAKGMAVIRRQGGDA